MLAVRLSAILLNISFIRSSNFLPDIFGLFLKDFVALYKLDLIFSNDLYLELANFSNNCWIFYIDHNKLYKIMREIYYQCLNTVLHFMHSSYWYYFCHKYQGYKLNYNKGPILCLICQFNYEINEKIAELIKYDKMKLMVFLS